MLDLIRRHKFAPSDFVLTERGVCRLHQQLSRTVAGLAVNDLPVQEVASMMVREWPK